MSKIQKSNLTVNGNSVHVSMPFAKVDKSKRLVHGWATLDNVDTQGDIVTAEASAKAFARARGNIREMHQPIAVGKMIDFREDEYFDKDTNSLYRGIFVTARVSKGAEDTWEKVLDGTLTGFSIGGEVTKSRSEYVAEADNGNGKVVKFIEDYDLVELSLVDNPANQLANLFSIEKTAGSVKVNAGAAVDADIENVFYCKNGHDNAVILVNGESSTSCPECGLSMENIGWFESGSDKSDKISEIVSKFLTPVVEESALDSDNERGAELSKVNNEDSAVKVESKDEEAAVGAKDEALEKEASTEPAESAEIVDEIEPDGDESEVVDEVEDLDSDEKISKKIDALQDAVQKSLKESKEETLLKVSELEGKIDEAKDAFIKKASELELKYEEFGQKFEASKQRLAELETQFEKINSADAVKKSAGLDQSGGKVEQKPTSFWDGAFSR